MEQTIIASACGIFSFKAGRGKGSEVVWDFNSIPIAPPERSFGKC